MATLLKLTQGAIEGIDQSIITGSLAAVTLAMNGDVPFAQRFILAAVTPGGTEADEISALVPGQLSTGTSYSLAIDAIASYEIRLEIQVNSGDPWTVAGDPHYVIVEDQYGMPRLPDQATRTKINYEGQQRSWVDVINRLASGARAGISASGASAPLTLTVDDTNTDAAPLRVRHTKAGAVGQSGWQTSVWFEAELTDGDFGVIAAARSTYTGGGVDAQTGYLELGVADGAGGRSYPLRVDNGAVGIGTFSAAPVGPLEVRSVSGIAYITRDAAAGSHTMLRLRRQTTNVAFFGINASDHLEIGTTSTRLTVTTAGCAVTGTISATGLLTASAKALVDFTDGSPDAVAMLAQFLHTASGGATGGGGAGIEFASKNGSGTYPVIGDLAAVYTTVTAGSEDAYLRLRAIKGGTLTEVMRVAGSATPSVGINLTAAPAATVHAKSHSSAAAAWAVCILDKVSGGAVAGNRLQEWYRDTSTLLAYLEADTSDHVYLRVGAGKNLYIDAGSGSGSANLSVAGTVKVSAGVTVVTVTTALTLSGSSAINIGGALNHDGTTVGFYGVTPVTRPAAYTLNSGTLSRNLPASGNTADGVADVLRQVITDHIGNGLLQ